ncbi:MAG: organic hydroperoxide resistance protein [Acidobacteriaceae bacterium]
MKIMYTADVTAEGARHGHAISSDGLIDMDLARPIEMGGTGKATNPEQLFGAAYAACFGGAVEYNAQQEKIKTGTITVKSKVSLCRFDPGEGEGFGIKVDLDVTLPEMDQTSAEKLVAIAHRTCPYSNATRGNVEVNITTHGGKQ